MSTVLINQDNLAVKFNPNIYDLVYADCIYEREDLFWVYKYWNTVKPGGIFMIQTDYHTVALYKMLLDCLGTMVNWCIYLNEWGGTAKDRFTRKHDDILIYCKGKEWKWYPDRIQIEKKTAGTAFDKKGTGQKTPCDVFYDHVSFSTMSNERVKLEDGKGIQWQKPMWLAERLLLPFTDEGDFVLDPFMGSGTFGEWCVRNNRNYTGIELDPEVFKLAEKRIHGISKGY